MNYQHIKRFSDFKGLDLRSSEIMRPPGYAREALNMMHTDQGGLTQRFGYQIRTVGNEAATVFYPGLFGIFGYDAINLLGNAKSELLGCGAGNDISKTHDLYRRTTKTFTISNSNAAPATITIAYSEASSSIRLTIVRSGSTIYNEDLGTISNTLIDIDSLVATINATSGLSTLGTGVGVLTIASGLQVGEYIAGPSSTSPAAIPYYSWEAVNRPRFQYSLSSADISIANDTVTFFDASIKVTNPLKNGDKIKFYPGPGGVLPTSGPTITAGTLYTVVSATGTTVKLETSGGTPINFTGTGTAPFFAVCDTFNPGATFWNYGVELGEPGFSNVSSVQVRNNRYFTAGRVRPGTINSLPIRESAGLSKYDGQSFYRAGLPDPILPGGAVVLTTAPGTLTDYKGARARSGTGVVGGIRYQFQFLAVDKTGNIIESKLSLEFPLVSVTTAGVVPTLAMNQRLLSRISAEGFNSNYATVSSGGTSLTLTCNDSLGNAPNMDVGDIAYFWDNRQSRFIQREVTAVAATTITIAANSLDTNPVSPNYDDGQTPTVLTGASISANVRIVVWRAITAGEGAPKYLVEELPWSPIYSLYYDDKADGNLGAQLVIPAYNADLPPPSRYIAKYNDQIISFGNDLEDRTVYFEDIETPEGNPAGTHQFDLPNKATGAHQTGPFLIAATKDSLHEVSGDLSEFKFRVDQIGANVGVTSHLSMAEIEEGVLFFQSALGPYVLQNGRVLSPLGAIKSPDGRLAGRLEPIFTADYTNDNPRPAFERSIAVVVPNRRWYVLFVPTEDNDDPGIPAYTTPQITSVSYAYVYDYGRNTWVRWGNVNFASMCLFEDTIQFVYRTGLANIGFCLGYYGAMLMTRGKYNYCDHALPTGWDYQAHWESLGNPGILKKFLRCRISSHEDREAALTTFDLNTFVDYDPTAQSNDDTLTWTDELDLLPKLASENVRALMVQFTGNTPYQPMIISGYELEAAAPYRMVLKE